MKKLVLLFALVLMLAGCNRWRVKHDHSKQMQSVHVPVDSAQKDYVDELEKEDWENENVIVLPEESDRGSVKGNVDDVIERMMKGEDVQEGE